jgi:hypothetical protein
MKLSNYLYVALLCLGLAACGYFDKGPAEQAIKAASQSVESVRAEGSKFAAEQFKQLEGSLKAAQDDFAKGEYKAALAAAKDLGAKAQEVAKAAADKKAALTKSWEETSASIAQTLEAAHKKLEELAMAKKLPTDMTKEKLAELHSSFDAAMKQYEEAKSAAGSDIAKAAESADALKAKAAELAQALGIGGEAGK